MWTLGDYGGHRPLGDFCKGDQSHALHAFKLKSERAQQPELQYLREHGVFRHLLPTSANGGLGDHSSVDNACRYGPVTCGSFAEGEYSLCADLRLTWSLSGSTLHLAASGGAAAAGIVRIGTSNLTIVEPDHASAALRCANMIVTAALAEAAEGSDTEDDPDHPYAAHLAFKPYGKPGGATNCVNPPLLTPVLHAWKRTSIRHATIKLLLGDFYYLPAGVLNEFLYGTSCLVTAWNLLPPFGARSAQALTCMQGTLGKLAEDMLPQSADRYQSLLDDVPAELLQARACQPCRLDAIGSQT